MPVITFEWIDFH